MNIIELKVEGFARINAVEIRPDGAIVPINGKNSAGKSSVLRAIWALVEGRAAAPAVAINKNQSEALIYGDLGEYKVTRTIKRAKDGQETWDLKVVAADGSRITKTPQAVINAFKGDIAFDPLGWCRLPAKDQVAALQSLVDFDFEKAASRRKALYDDRTDANRRARQAETQVAAIKLPPGPRPKPVDVAAKIDALQQAMADNAAMDRELEDRAKRRNEAEHYLDEAEQLQARAVSLETRAKAIMTDLAARPPIAPEQRKDVSALREEIAAADKTKHVAAEFDARQRLAEEQALHEAASLDLTNGIAALDQEKLDAIAKAKLPVDGLALEDDGVMLHGVPLAQAGTAEKIECAVAIAMAKNPRLKVILVDEGSELDADAMEFVAKLAEARGFQVWVASVKNKDDGVGFYIVDGEVAL